jgi:hypothetical protein
MLVAVVTVASTLVQRMSSFVPAATAVNLTSGPSIVVTVTLPAPPM